MSFNNVKDAANANSMQIAEVELLGTLTPTPPAITVDVHPTDVLCLDGYATTLSLTASGTPPLHYQWKRNGADIAGATDKNYSFPALAATNTSDVVGATSPYTNTPSANQMAGNAGDPAPKIIDYPASFHGGAGTFAVADGHCVNRKWLGATIKPAITETKLPLGNNTLQPVDGGTAKGLVWWSTITAVRN